MSDELRSHVCAWLEANGVDPSNVPENASLSLVSDQLTTEVYVVNAAGKNVLTSDQRELARTTTTVTIRTPPPADVAEWLRTR